MITLAFDTSTLIGAVGWIRTAEEPGAGYRPAVRDFADCAGPASPGHAETLIDRIAAALGAGNLDVDDVGLVVFGRGPGTFTGLRLGLSTAKGVAIGCGASLVGMSSLAALALSVGREGRVATLIDARRGELFHCAYDVTLASGWPEAHPLDEERVAPAAEAIAAVLRLIGGDPVAVVGNGVAPYRDQLEAALPGAADRVDCRLAAPSAYWMARAGLERYLRRGGDDPRDLEPRYIREPDARLPGAS